MSRLDPDDLLAHGLVERAPNGQRWRPPGCDPDRWCLPGLDFDRRRGEKLVGVACPQDPPCWLGVEWFPASSLEFFVVNAADLLARLRDQTELDRLKIPDLGESILPIGMLERLGKKVAIIWMRTEDSTTHTLCLQVRRYSKADALIVLVSNARELETRVLKGRIAVATLTVAEDARLALGPSLDLLFPDYRTHRLKHPLAIFDDVYLEFATRPGGVHSVRINGMEHEGVAKSDLKFVRLLLLAAARAADPDVGNGGWVSKTDLEDDAQDHELAKLRDALAGTTHASLSPAELKALVQPHPKRDGRIRLALHPRKIRFDPSIASLEFLRAPTRRSSSTTPGAAQVAINRRKGLLTAGRLLNRARSFGCEGVGGTTVPE